MHTSLAEPCKRKKQNWKKKKKRRENPTTKRKNLKRIERKIEGEWLTLTCTTTKCRTRDGCPKTAMTRDLPHTKTSVLAKHQSHRGTCQASEPWCAWQGQSGHLDASPSDFHGYFKSQSGRSRAEVPQITSCGRSKVPQTMVLADACSNTTACLA